MQGYSFKLCSALDTVLGKVKEAGLNMLVDGDRSVAESAFGDSLGPYFWLEDAAANAHHAAKLSKYLFGEHLLFASKGLDDLAAKKGIRWSCDATSAASVIDGVVAAALEAGEWREALSNDGRKYYWCVDLHSCAESI